MIICFTFRQIKIDFYINIISEIYINRELQNKINKYIVLAQKIQTQMRDIACFSNKKKLKICQDQNMLHLLPPATFICFSAPCILNVQVLYQFLLIKYTMDVDGNTMTADVVQKNFKPSV